MNKRFSESTYSSSKFGIVRQLHRTLRFGVWALDLWVFILSISFLKKRAMHELVYPEPMVIITSILCNYEPPSERIVAIYRSSSINACYQVS